MTLQSSYELWVPVRSHRATWDSRTNTDGEEPVHPQRSSPGHPYIGKMQGFKLESHYASNPLPQL